MISYTIGIKSCVDTIFAGVLIGGIDVENPLKMEKAKQFNVLVSRFIGNFPSNIFINEYALIYEILTSLKIKYFSMDELRTIIGNHRELILDSPYIDMTRWSHTSDSGLATADEKVEAFTEDTIDLFQALSNRLVMEEEFISACNMYVDWYKVQFHTETVQLSAMIMSDSGYIHKMPGRRTKNMRGVEDALTFYNDRTKILRELDEKNKIKSDIIDLRWYEEQEELDEKGHVDEGLDFGIEELDSVIGSLKRGNLLTVLGPPKGGKTRFCNYLTQRALSQKLNVCVWPIEGNPKEWMDMQVASYIRRTSGINMSTKEINSRKFKPDQKKLVSAARLAISSGVEMGRLSFISGACYVEDFLETLEAHYNNENPFDVLVIDQLVNVQSKRGTGKVERLSEAYMKIAGFLENGVKTPVIGLMPAQLKQSVVDDLRKEKADDISETAGGETAETIRSADEVIGLFSTKDERESSIARIYSVASRHSENFKNFLVKAEYGCCHYYSDASLNQ